MSEAQGTLGEFIDALYQKRAERLEKQREVEDLKVAEKEAEDRVIAALKKNGMRGARGELATVSISERNDPMVVDWDALWEHIFKTRDTTLLQKRIGVTAWREHLDSGELLPGTEPEEVTVLSITKARKAK